MCLARAMRPVMGGGAVVMRSGALKRQAWGALRALAGYVVLAIGRLLRSWKMQAKGRAQLLRGEATYVAGRAQWRAAHAR